MHARALTRCQDDVSQFWLHDFPRKKVFGSILSNKDLTGFAATRPAKAAQFHGGLRAHVTITSQKILTFDIGILYYSQD
jgi:hypothetical protein